MTPMTLEELYNGLNSGKSYILKKELAAHLELFMSGKYRYFVPQCNLTCDDKYECICWHGAGSSAVKNTLDQLEWTLEAIFDLADPEDFVELSYETMLDVMNGEYGKVRG